MSSQKGPREHFHSQSDDLSTPRRFYARFFHFRNPLIGFRSRIQHPLLFAFNTIPKSSSTLPLFDVSRRETGCMYGTFQLHVRFRVFRPKYRAFNGRDPGIHYFFHFFIVSLDNATFRECTREFSIRFEKYSGLYSEFIERKYASARGVLETAFFKLAGRYFEN